MAAKRRSKNTARKPIVLPPGQGRHYPMGRISAVFKADEAETAHGYSISEWWLEPNTTGPGAHAHPEDDVFFVLEGTMSFLVANEWVQAPAGSFVLVPGGVTHAPTSALRRSAIARSRAAARAVLLQGILERPWVTRAG